MTAVADVATDLYALPADAFTAARDDRARRLREDGERDVAEQVKRLRRPTTAAWVVNQLVRAHRDEVDRLLELGAALREAQEALAGEDLKELNRQQHQVVAAVRRRAVSAAADAGHALSESVRRQVEATLRAGMADPAAAAAVRSGLLTAPLESTGFASVDLDGAVALPEAVPTSPPAESSPARRSKAGGGDTANDGRSRRAGRRDDRRQADERAAARKARAESEKALAEAERAEAAAGKELAAKDGAVEELERRRAEVAERLAEVRRQLDELEQRGDEVADELRRARSARQGAARAVAAAGRATERARRRVDRVGDG